MNKKMMFALAFGLATAVAWSDVDYVRYVNTLVGTVAEGNTFPGACRPFGMVQASPDSGREIARRCAGFDLRDDVIRSFSQTHVNGTGRPADGRMSRPSR